MSLRARATMAGTALALLTGLMASPASAAPIPDQHQPNPIDIGHPFDCPISFHGQWPSRCVWVKKDNQQFVGRQNIPGLWYCPGAYPYPYEVALGFDPLWEDTSRSTGGSLEYSVSVATVGVRQFAENAAGTRYLSWTGDAGSPGYVSAILHVDTGTGSQPPNAGAGFKYLCSTKKANGGVP